MKGIVRAIVFNSLTLFMMSQAFGGLVVRGGFQTYIVGGVALSLLSFFFRPILSILALPLTIITFGTFGIVINAIILLALTLFVRQISIQGFILPRTTFFGFIFPQITFNTFFAFLFLALIFTLIRGLIGWFRED